MSDLLPLNIVIPAGERQTHAIAGTLCYIQSSTETLTVELRRADGGVGARVTSVSSGHKLRIPGGYKSAEFLNESGASAATVQVLYGSGDIDTDGIAGAVSITGTIATQETAVNDFASDAAVTVGTVEQTLYAANAGTVDVYFKAAASNSVDVFIVKAGDPVEYGLPLSPGESVVLRCNAEVKGIASLAGQKVYRARTQRV